MTRPLPPINAVLDCGECGIEPPKTRKEIKAYKFQGRDSNGLVEWEVELRPVGPCSVGEFGLRVSEDEKARCPNCGEPGRLRFYEV